MKILKMHLTNQLFMTIYKESLKTTIVAIRLAIVTIQLAIVAIRLAIDTNGNTLLEEVLKKNVF